NAIPIIFVTAIHKDHGNVKRGYSLGAIDYLFKPISVDVVRAKVAAFIELFRQKEALRQAMHRARRAESQLAVKAAELARSNEELEQFAYVASHDLKEPLRMVNSYMQLLSRRYQGKLGADADEFISFAVEGAERMRVLIDDLLAYSRVGSRGKPFAATDCRKLLETTLLNLRIAIEDSGAQVQLGDLPTIPADERQLGQLFQNLIANAIKFRGSAAPVIEVKAQPLAQLRSDTAAIAGLSADDCADDGWLFSVRDNGIGIAPQFFAKIFLIFQRLHQRDEYPGTGIGLAVCKKIVDRHGGRIWVDSTPGQGTTFYFTVPQSQAMAESASRPVATCQ
ncbi:MAG TPA: ATP-binding protein, partial [Terriglobales bacterium]|nr:ATP-binding protein [Terriglobales bacterium]